MKSFNSSFVLNIIRGRNIQLILYFNNLLIKQNRLRLCSKLYHSWNDALNVDYICNENNKEEIEMNNKYRHSLANVNKVLSMYNTIRNLESRTVEPNLLKEFEEEILKFPNRSHPSITGYGEIPKEIKIVGNKVKKDFKELEFTQLCKMLNILRAENLNSFAGERSYYFKGALAELEEALIQYSVNKLLKINFKFYSVPDILDKDIIESCGMQTDGERSQVYKLDPKLHGPNLCLSGTSEMALAGLLRNNTFSASDLPLRMAAVSRCFRAEISPTAKEKGIYRVHQFTKVEMFGVTDDKHSDQLHEEFRDIQEEIFLSLGLHFKVLDMPPIELGSPAYRKFDVEAWMPGRKMYGEVSSCSNCTDYQSRRLNIRYSDPLNKISPLYVHTVNGTACAVPRTLIALLETHQLRDRTISIPEVLRPYMGGRTEIGIESRFPKTTLYYFGKK